MTTPTANMAHAVWSVLPNGYADRERTRLRLSLVVSPRAITVNGLLGDLQELADWPAQFQALNTVSLFVEGQPGVVTAQVTSPRPSSALWKTLFPPTTKVQLAGGGEIGDLEQVVGSVSYRPLVQALREIYRGGVYVNGARHSDTPLTRALTGLAKWSLAGPAISARAKAVVPSASAAVQTTVAGLLDPATMTAGSIAQAAELLRANGLPDAAAVAPLVSVIRRLRAASAGIGPPGEPGPGPVDNVRTADQADFHQVLGLVTAQPVLALALGLRFDLEMPAFVGPRTIRVTGLPLLIPNGAPWSRVVADPDTGRFVMATEPEAPTEVVQGMLDLRPDGPGADKYVVTTMDVVGATAQLAGMAGARASAGANGAGAAPTTPPPRRNTGITVAQVDRRAEIVSHTVARGKLLAASFGQPASADPVRPATPTGTKPAAVAPGEAVLYADDVTTGYRVDVRDLTSGGGGEWRSLMRRTARYTIGRDRTTTLVADGPGFDEGAVDPMPAVQQSDAAGFPHVEFGETIFLWDGWGLSTRRPGKSVSLGPDGRVVTELVPTEVSANHPLRIDISQKPGTLPRLRYGRTYQFRVRTVDLAGNSIDPDLCDPELVSPPVTYRRLDVLPAPELVLRRPLTAGESVDRVVVRSDGEGNPVGTVPGGPVGTAERHVAPARAWQQLAELHGHFDAAIGPDSPERVAARQRLLAIGANEAGAFTDTMVPDPADPTRKIPAPGIRIAVNEDAAEPPTGTLQGLVRGQALPQGEYVVHDANAPYLPYLPDPLAIGIALAGLPTPGGDVVTAKYGGSRVWPDVQPMRLIAKAGTGGGAGVSTGTVDGRPTLTVTVPPAAELITTLSSTLTPAGLALMDIDLPDAGAEQAALAGQEPLLTPGREIRFVHAVRKPLLPLAMQTATADPDRKVGATVVDVTGTAKCHPASTSRIDIEATWEEVVDDGGLTPVRFEKRTAVTGSVTVAPGQSTVPWKVRHSLGDGKRRDIAYRPVATTRFREYFPPGTPTEQLVRRVENGVTTTAINTTRPDPPDVHSVLPTFTWQRTVSGGVLTSVRRTAGVRVWLRRPWEQTGTGERLGVVVYGALFHGANGAEAERNNLHPIHSTTSRWNGDPLDGWGHAGAHLLAGNFPARLEVGSPPAEQVKPFPNANPVNVGRNVLGHAVHYDPDRDLWYSDIDITIDDDQMYFPFVRLGLVRYQPKSAPGCHFSSIVVTDAIQLPPTRTLTASAPAADRVKITVTGQWINNSKFEVTVVSRAPDPLLGFSGQSDVAVLALNQGGNHHLLATTVVGNSITASGEVPVKPVGVPAGQPVSRLVVRELQIGDSLHHPGEGPQTQPTGGANRAVYVETVDQAVLKPS